MEPARVRTAPEPLLEQLRSPWPAWLLVLSGLLIFSPLVEGGTTHLAVMIIRLMVLVLLSLYLVKGLRAARLSCPRVHIGPALLAYLGLACLSTIGSPYANQSIQWLLVLMSYAVLLYLLVYFIDEWDHVVKLLVVLVGTGFVESVTALSQADWSGSIRATGTFFNPNFLAAYLTAVATVLLSYLCYSRSPWRRRRGVWTELIRYLILVAGLVVVLLALVSTGSRGGMLAMLAGATLVVGLRFGRRGLLVLVLFFGALLLIASPLRDRLQAEHVSNPVGYARWHIWHSSLQVMKEEPFGVGLGLYQYLSPRYAFPVEGQITRYGKLAKTAHNEYLHMGVELGLVSIAIFCWGVVGLARQAGAALRGRLTRWQRGIVVGTGGAVTAILVQAAVDSTLHAPAVAVVLTLCAGILLSLRKLCGGATRSLFSIAVRPPWVRMAGAGAAAGVVVCVAIAVARLGFGWMAFEAGSGTDLSLNYAKAVANYRTAIALDPGKSLYHSAIAAAYFQAFQETDDVTFATASLQELKEAKALNPLDGRLSGLLGRVYVALSSRKPGSELAGSQTGETREGWLQLARAAYERAAVLEPFNPFHRLELARLYEVGGEPERAELMARRAVELEPNFLPGRAWLARFYLKASQIEAASAEYREIVARQQRYARWTKGPLEERFLTADVSGLEARLRKAGAHT